MGKQKYFLAVIDMNNEFKTIDKLDGLKLNGLKTIDKFTSIRTKKEIIDLIQKQYTGIKVKDVKLEYRKDDINTSYYGIITNNREFKECLDKFKNGKKDIISRNKNIFLQEFNNLEITIITNLDFIEEIYGISSKMYARAANYKDNRDHSNEDRELLIEEFSKYNNFRRWLVRNEKEIKIKKEKKDTSNQEYKQMHINELLYKLPDLNAEIDELMEEQKKKETTSDKELTIKQLQYQKEQLLKFNRKDDEKEEFLEMDDFERSAKDDVEDWKPRKWKVRKK